MTLYGNLLQEKKYRAVARYFLVSVAATCALGVVCMIGVFLLGKPVMGLVFTKQILPYVHYLYPLVAVMIIYSLTMCCNSVLISMRLNKQVTWFSAASMLVCVVCSFCLIERYAIEGVLWTMGISYGFQFVVQVAFLVFQYRKL